MQINQFDYLLPKELIAQIPVRPRDTARLLVTHRVTGKIQHHRFYQLPDLLQPHDLLVLNNTKVIPARLTAQKSTGGKVNLLLVKETHPARWTALINPVRGIKVGTKLTFPGQEIYAVVCTCPDKNKRTGFMTDTFTLQFYPENKFTEFLNNIGKMPVPPYIKSNSFLPEEYQTIYATKSGAIAAPTAGLHFTDRVFTELKTRQIQIAMLTLHVGLGTFIPIRTTEISQHPMQPEFYHLPADTVNQIKRTKEQGGRIIAVGTTVVRALETQTRDGTLYPGTGWTDLYIYPGYRFQTVSAMVTNFHLPKSTLYILVCAFAGLDLVREIYQTGIKEKYRFYSFGDAMLIF